MDIVNFILLDAGVTVLIVILVLFIHFKWTKYTAKNVEERVKRENQRRMDEFREAVIDSNKSRVNQFAKSFNSTVLKNTHQKELIETFSKLRNIIKDDLYTTMDKVQSCRIALYLLHNGQKSSAGISFIKVSCIGERIKIGSGIKEQISNHSNLPINIFDNMLDKLIENGKYLIMNDEETMQTARSQFISSSKIKYSYAVSIYDTSNNILGFVLAEFDHIYTKNTSEEEYEALKNFCARISPILSFTEYADMTVKASSNNNQHNSQD